MTYDFDSNILIFLDKKYIEKTFLCLKYNKYLKDWNNFYINIIYNKNLCKQTIKKNIE